MEKSQHTPGTWKIEYAIGEALAITNGKETIVEFGGHTLSKADSNNYSHDIDKINANAKLIALAPQMLKHLQKIVELKPSQVQDYINRDIIPTIKKATSI